LATPFSKRLSPAALVEVTAANCPANAAELQTICDTGNTGSALPPPAFSAKLQPKRKGGAATMTDLTPHAIDPNLLNGAVDFINRAIHASGTQLAAILSEYVIDTFFGGEVSLLSSKDPTKTASFRALCEHPGLQMGASTLHRLVKIGVQVSHLPADISENLTMTHHRALLTVQEPGKKASLARKAVKHHWTAQKLQEVIAAEFPQPADTRGRPTKPEVLKWLGALRTAAGDKRNPAAFAADFAKLTEVDQAATLLTMAELRSELDALLAAVSA